MAACLLVLVTSTLLFNAGFAQVCLEFEDVGSRIPRTPPQFSTEIEANILHFNYTLHAFEYIDNINNLARVDVHSSLGEVNITIINYNKAEVSHITTSANGKKSCFAIPLARESSRLSRRLFGTDIINGTAHVATSRNYIFEILVAGNGTGGYIGTELVRGIPCYRVQSCYYTSSEGRLANYSVDLYFTQPNWSSRPRQVPVQFIVNGTVTESNGSTRQMNNIYSYINFQYGLPDDNVFRVPPGQPCQGRQIGKKLPPLPKDYYSVLYENVNPLLSTISYFKVICTHVHYYM